MIAYLLLRRRDATYNHPLATIPDEKQHNSKLEEKLLKFANPQKSKESFRHIASSATHILYPIVKQILKNYFV